jgi:hypothetical protein
MLLAVKNKMESLLDFFFLFGGDVVGLSIATRYGASKSDAPTRNLVTTIEFSCDGSLSGLRFRAGF